MRLISLPLLLLCATVCAQESPTTPNNAKRQLAVTNSWFANSHADASFMPQGIEAMVVTADGTTYTNIGWEEGGGNVAVVTADGIVQPRPHQPGYFGWGHGGGMAVAANATYVFFTQNYNNEGGGLKNPDNWPPADKDWYGISRRLRADLGKGPAIAGGKGGKDSPVACFLPVHEVPSSTKPEVAHIRGLCASNDELFVSCPFDKKIRVYDAETMALKRSWEVDAPCLLALDGKGGLWVTVGPDATVIKRFDLDGKAMPQAITLPEGSRVGSLCIDAKGRMLIGDVGQNECVLLYDDLATKPKPTGTFGTKNGIYSGTPGALGPLKFHQVRGIGSDSSGAIYIGNTEHRTTGPGVWLEKYTPAGALLWRRYGVVFTDSGAVDPASDGKIFYGMTERYDVDLTKPPGQEASLAAYTANFYKYPYDPRFVEYDNAGVYVRTIEKKTFIVTTGMGSGQSAFCLYRLNPATDGEVMIPCVVWSASRKYPHAPDGQWLWRDTNGNGQFDEGEYSKTTVHDAYGGNSAFMDTRGDVWMTCWGPLRKITCQGLDKNGVPIYDGKFEVIDAPKPFGGIRRLRYDPATDVMFLGGTVEGEKTHHWKSMGNHVCRYDQWSTGNRTAAWHVICNFQPGGNCEPLSFDVAGDHVFVALAERGKVGGDREVSRGHIDVYESKTGAPVGFIEPPSDWGVGWMDAVECLSVFRRKNGEYLIIQEDDGRSKNLLYRWNPAATSGSSK
jgi:hypothetical protein